MKITKNKLQKIIKEEVVRILKEERMVNALKYLMDVGTMTDEEEAADWLNRGDIGWQPGMRDGSPDPASYTRVVNAADAMEASGQIDPIEKATLLDYLTTGQITTHDYETGTSLQETQYRIVKEELNKLINEQNWRQYAPYAPEPVPYMPDYGSPRDFDPTRTSPYGSGDSHLPGGRDLGGQGRPPGSVLQGDNLGYEIPLDLIAGYGIPPEYLTPEAYADLYPFGETRALRFPGEDPTGPIDEGQKENNFHKLVQEELQRFINESL